MEKQKYIVIKPWHGVKAGDVVEFENVHPSLKPNVSLMSDGVKTSLEDAESKAVKIIEDAEAKAKEIILEAEKKASQLTPATPKAIAAKQPAKKEA